MFTLDSVTSNIKGFLRLSRENDNSAYLLFNVNDVTSKNGWWLLMLIYNNHPQIYLRK